MKYTESHNPRGEKTSKPQLCRGGDSGAPRVRVRATASWPCTLCLPTGILSGTCGVAPRPVRTPLGRTPTPPCCLVRSLSWAGTHTPALCAQNGSHSRNKQMIKRRIPRPPVGPVVVGGTLLTSSGAAQAGMPWQDGWHPPSEALL